MHGQKNIDNLALLRKINFQQADGMGHTGHGHGQRWGKRRLSPRLMALNQDGPMPPAETQIALNRGSPLSFGINKGRMSDTKEKKNRDIKATASCFGELSCTLTCTKEGLNRSISQ